MSEPPPEDMAPVDDPAIGPPSANPERRQSPPILAPAARVMDPSGGKRRVVSLVVAAGHLSNNTFVRDLRGDEDIALLGQAADLDEAGTAITTLLPHVAVIGLDLGRDTPGVLMLCAALRENVPTVKIVAVAESDRPDDLFACLQSGAHSCFFGKTSPMTLRRTIVGAHRDESMLSPGVAERILADYQRLNADQDAVLAPAPTLTPTEEEVLQRLAAGETPQAIAERHEVTTRMIGLHAGYAVAKLHRTYYDDAQFRVLL